jgi:hypothetical protein
MGQPVVLPKLEVPRPKLHWSFRVLWIAGGLLAISVLILGGAMYRVHLVHAEAERVRDEKIAHEKAEAEAKIREAQVAAAKAAAEKAMAEAKAAEAAAAKSLALANTLPAAGAVPEDASKKASHHHRGHTSLRAHRMIASAKDTSSGSSAKTASGGSKRNDAAIDELLSKMK